MAEHIEGDFKQFRFKMATLEDYPKIFEHLTRVFYKEEPLCKLCGLTPIELEEWNRIVKCLLNDLEDDISFYVEEIATGKVAGIRLTYKCLKNGPSRVNFEIQSTNILNALGILFGVNEQAHIFERYPDIDYYADFLMTSVDPAFQRQGLVTEIYRRSMEMLKAKGYPLCKSIFTSPFTRRAATKLQFVELARLRFKDYKNEKGEIVFPHADDDMLAAVMAFKLL